MARQTSGDTSGFAFHENARNDGSARGNRGHDPGRGNKLWVQDHRTSFSHIVPGQSADRPGAGSSSSIRNSSVALSRSEHDKNPRRMKKGEIPPTRTPLFSRPLEKSGFPVCDRHDYAGACRERRSDAMEYPEAYCGSSQSSALHPEEMHAYCSTRMDHPPVVRNARVNRTASTRSTVPETAMEMSALPLK